MQIRVYVCRGCRKIFNLENGKIPQRCPVCEELLSTNQSICLSAVCRGGTLIIKPLKIHKIGKPDNHDIRKCPLCNSCEVRRIEKPIPISKD